MRHEEQPQRAHEQMDTFLQETFKPHPGNPTKYHYRRH